MQRQQHHGVREFEWEDGGVAFICRTRDLGDQLQAEDVGLV